VTWIQFFGEMIFIGLVIAVFVLIVVPIKVLLDFIDDKYEK
jgi:hypothetical protein